MVQQVRAKFRCQQIVVSETSQTITLGAVESGAGNADWSKWTPSGKLEFTVTNPAVFGFYVPGKSYYIDMTEFVPVEDPLGVNALARD